MKHQSRFNALYRMLGAGALGWPRGMVLEEGWREEASGWGRHVYLWWIHFDIWQNQYNIVKLKNFFKNGKKKRPWCWERLRAVEGDYRGWDCWMASPTQWTMNGFRWIPGVGDGQGGLACCGSLGRRVGHDWATELTELTCLLQAFDHWLLSDSSSYVGSLPCITICV